MPAYNEAMVIESSLASLISVVKPENVYVVSDGSTDDTAKLARTQVTNVLALRKNRGKAQALEQLINKYHLTKRYQYVFFFDADSQLSKNFLAEVRQFAKSKPACIVGTVGSQRRGIISAYRVYEYSLSHRFFKTAQNLIRAIAVAPGCASLYRADVLEKLNFSNQTLTEDFDLTLQIHQKKLGQVIYASKAIVTTQDPIGFSDYWKQIMRWCTGFWQNFFLHRLYFVRNRASAMIMLNFIDGLTWLLAIRLAIVYPAMFIHLISLAYLIVVVIAICLVCLEQKYWAIVYTPFFPFFQYLNLAAYIASFFRAIFSGKRRLGWQKVLRYSN